MKPFKRVRRAWRLSCSGPHNSGTLAGSDGPQPEIVSCVEGGDHARKVSSECVRRAAVLNVSKKEWRRPILRKLPVAETSLKAKGNEGTGGGKGENTIVS